MNQPAQLQMLELGIKIVMFSFWLAAKAASHILGPFSDTESYF